MNELLDILQEINPNVDFVSIIDAVQDHFKIELDGKDIDPDNFMSAAAIWNMVERYI